jgi:hypothetical protein
MKFIHPNTRKFVIGALVASALGISSLFMQQNWLGQTERIANMNSGLGTCFTRVTQTFTALMISDFYSSYLSKDFTDLTGDCFSDMNKEFKSVFGKDFKTAGNTLGQLVSDTHWFHEKVEKVHKMATEGGVSLTNSSIINKYSGLEGVKDKFQEQIENAKMETASVASTWFMIAIGLMGVAVALGGAWYVTARKQKQKFIDVEHIAEHMLEQRDMAEAKIDRLMQMALNTANFPETLKLFNNYHTKILESRSQIEVSDEKVTPVVVDNRSISNLNSSFDVALKGVQNKAFTHGVIIDFDLDEDMMIYGESEDVQQVLYTMMNYSIDSSMHHNHGRRITVRSKPLGGTVYLKVNVTGHCFNATELDYLSSSVESADVDMNLMMLKELVDVSSIRYEVKNKLDDSGTLSGSEVEFIFDRADVATTQTEDVMEAKNADQLEMPIELDIVAAADRELEGIFTTPDEANNKQISIMKGSKKEILAQLQSKVPRMDA